MAWARMAGYTVLLCNTLLTHLLWILVDFYFLCYSSEKFKVYIDTPCIGGQKITDLEFMVQESDDCEEVTQTLK